MPTAAVRPTPEHGLMLACKYNRPPAMTTMDKVFDPRSYEPKWQRTWREQDLFRAEAPSERPSFWTTTRSPT